MGKRRIENTVPEVESFSAPLSGHIKKVFKDKGFGFVKTDSGDEFFFHRSSVDPPRAFEFLVEGQAVSFEIGDSAKGPRAERVQQVG